MSVEMVWEGESRIGGRILDSEFSFASVPQNVSHELIADLGNWRSLLRRGDSRSSRPLQLVGYQTAAIKINGREDWICRDDEAENS